MYLSTPPHTSLNSTSWSPHSHTSPPPVGPHTPTPHLHPLSYLTSTLPHLTFTHSHTSPPHSHTSPSPTLIPLLHTLPHLTFTHSHTSPPHSHTSPSPTLIPHPHFTHSHTSPPHTPTSPSPTLIPHLPTPTPHPLSYLSSTHSHTSPTPTLIHVPHLYPLPHLTFTSWSTPHGTLSTPALYPSKVASAHSSCSNQSTSTWPNEMVIPTKARRMLGAQGELALRVWL